MNDEIIQGTTQDACAGDQTSMNSSTMIQKDVEPCFTGSPRTERRLSTALVALLLGMLSSAAYGQEAPPAPASPAPLGSTEMPAQAQSPELQRALRPLSWPKAPGRRVAFGIEDGLWGRSWSQGLRVSVPFSQYFGATLRGVYLIDMTGGPFTADAGGRFEFFGRSDVFFNVLRLYGGGGVQVLAPAANTEGREVMVGGGGQFGFEFFCSPHHSFFLEVGGQGGMPSPGATVLAGMMFYPWTR